MTIKSEIEKRRQVQIEREEALKAKLLGEINSQFEKSVQGTVDEAQSYLDALQRTNCKAYLEELRKSYGLKYQGPEEAKLETTIRMKSIPKTSGGIASSKPSIDESFSDDQLADKVKGSLEEVRRVLVERNLNQNSLREMADNPAATNSVRQEIHDKLNVKKGEGARVVLEWNYRSTGIYHEEYWGHGTELYGSDCIEAAVSRKKDDKWNLRIVARRAGHRPVIEHDLPEKDWKPESIQEPIIQGFLKLTRGSHG